MEILQAIGLEQKVECTRKAQENEKKKQNRALTEMHSTEAIHFRFDSSLPEWQINWNVT